MENNWDFFPDFSLFGEGLQGQWLNGVDNMVTREILEESARDHRNREIKKRGLKFFKKGTSGDNFSLIENPFHKSSRSSRSIY